MKYNWEDLPKPLNCFTVRNATMINLNTKKIIQYYSANTKIVVVQKCVTEKGTYYRTDSARHHYLNYAFEATALGLPNEVAPSVPSHRSKSSSIKHPKLRKPGNRTLSRTEKQTKDQKIVSPKDGGEKQSAGWLRKIFRRKK